MIARILSIDDVAREQVVSLADEFFAEAKIPGRFHYEHFRKTFSTTLDMGIAAAWVSRRDGRVVGMLCGMLYPDPFTGELSAVENFWFVTADCRGVDGLKLLHEFEIWARQSGASKISVAHMAVIHPESMGEFYRRRGYKHVESVYMMGTT